MDVHEWMLTNIKLGYCMMDSAREIIPCYGLFDYISKLVLVKPDPLPLFPAERLSRAHVLQCQLPVAEAPCRQVARWLL